MVAGKTRTGRPAAQFSVIGGSVVANFVNTRSMGTNGLVDDLPSFADLVAWAEFFALATPAQARQLRAMAGSTAAKAALVRALAIREAVRAQFESNRRDRSIAPRVVRLLNAALERQSGRWVFEKQSAKLSLHFAARMETPTDLVAVIAREAAAFLASDYLARVRPCEGAKCVLWFVDRTRNGSRHWCRMDRCGARAKSAAYYRRRKSWHSRKRG